MSGAGIGLASDDGSQRSSRSPTGARAVLVSAVIGGLLLLQSVASFDLFPLLVGKPTRNFWPFLDYPMYSVGAREGAAVERLALFAVCEGGREHRLVPSDFALTRFQFDVHLMGAAQEEDREAVQRYMAAYRGPRDCRQPAALRLESRPLLLRRHGHVEGPPQATLVPLQ